MPQDQKHNNARNQGCHCKQSKVANGLMESKRNKSVPGRVSLVFRSTNAFTDVPENDKYCYSL